MGLGAPDRLSTTLTHFHETVDRLRAKGYEHVAQAALNYAADLDHIELTSFLCELQDVEARA